MGQKGILNTKAEIVHAEPMQASSKQKSMPAKDKLNSTWIGGSKSKRQAVAVLSDNEAAMLGLSSSEIESKIAWKS